MITLFQYPERVTQQPDGSYCWYSPIDVEYFLRGVRLCKKIFLIIAACILAFGVYFYLDSHELEPVAIVVVCDAIFLIIGFGTCLLVQRLAKNPREIYSMTADHIRIGSGKNQSFFSFSKVKMMTETRKYIELKGKVLSTRIYVPEEDMLFVRNYISIHLPADAERHYE